MREGGGEGGGMFFLKKVKCTIYPFNIVECVCGRLGGQGVWVCVVNGLLRISYFKSL